MGLDLRGDFKGFDLGRDDVSACNIGVFLTVSSRSGIALVLISPSLGRLERRVVDVEGRSSMGTASKSVTEEWCGLTCAESFGTRDAPLFIEGTVRGRIRDVLWVPVDAAQCTGSE